MAGINAFGTRFQKQVDMAWEDIADITSISGPGLERDTIDVSSHQSPQAWREHIGGMKDAGEVSIDVNYDPADHDELVADLDAEEPMSYRIVFPDEDETTWTFQAIMTGFEPDAPHDDKLSASLSFKVTGRPSLSSEGS